LSGRYLDTVKKGGTAERLQEASVPCGWEFFCCRFFVVAFKEMSMVATPHHLSSKRQATPSFLEFAGRAEATSPGTRSVPIYREVLADFETPVSVYLKVTQGLENPGFILESVEGGIRIARYSFIGTGFVSTLTLRDGVMEETTSHGVNRSPYEDPLAAVASVIERYQSLPVPGLPSFTGGAVGYLSYDAIQRFEPRVGMAEGAGLGYPEAQFHVADSMVVFDHLERTMKIVAHVLLGDGSDLEAAYQDACRRIDELEARLSRTVPSYEMAARACDLAVVDRFRPNTSPERYRDIVERAKQYIYEGDIFQVVLSQRVDIPTAANPFTIYRALRMVNPSPYMFYLDFGDRQVVGASPELLVRLEDGVVTNHPIAGTRPRGSTTREDLELEADLMSDEKELAEHIMLVDLGRNDVGRVSLPGSVHVPKLMQVERFSHVMHIVSNVEGRIDESNYDAMDALRSCFPAGTVSGAPKIRAMEIIAELETDRRGVYSGAVGHFDFSGGMDTCIALRTMVVQDGVASLQAGGGIVADSTPEGEYAESFHKMRALVRAIERAEAIELTESATSSDGTEA
jgi:anthranilate synthase component 1